MLYKTVSFLRTMTRLALCSVLFLSACAAPTPSATPKITVAAASNLSGVLEEIVAAFQKQTGIEVLLSYGSTAQLSQQIENGAPFDVFAAADTQHIDQLIEKKLLVADSRAIYAQGQLALWIPNAERLAVRDIKDLTSSKVRFIALAQPMLAPYGEASVEALKASGIWESLQAKIVYASNISMARQFAATGNADAAFTAYSLVLKEPGAIVKIDPQLYTPIDQALGIVTTSNHLAQTHQFTKFLMSSEGQNIFRNGGYLIP